MGKPHILLLNLIGYNLGLLLIRWFESREAEIEKGLCNPVGHRAMAKIKQKERRLPAILLSFYCDHVQRWLSLSVGRAETIGISDGGHIKSGAPRDEPLTTRRRTQQRLAITWVGS